VITYSITDAAATIFGSSSSPYLTGATSVTANGSATANFIDLSAVTANLIINGLAGADTINGGSGDDTITGGAGADTIDLSIGGTDTIVFSTTFTAGNASVDTVSSFTINSDLFNVDFNLLNGTTAATATLVAIAPVAVANNGAATANDVIYTFAGANDVLTSGTTSSTAVANAVTALTSTADFAASNVATGDSFLLQMNDGTDTFLFHYVADATAAVTTAADLELIAILSGTTTAFTTGGVI